jgi:hypothetical protein
VWKFLCAFSQHFLLRLGGRCASAARPAELVGGPSGVEQHLIR